MIPPGFFDNPDIRVRQGGPTPRTRQEFRDAYAQADAMLAKGEWELEVTFVTGLSVRQVRKRKQLLDIANTQP